MPKVLLATEKPFAAAAVDGIKKIFTEAGFETILLEKYTDKNDLLKAVADVDAMIIRSDKATREVIEASKNLKIIVKAVEIGKRVSFHTSRHSFAVLALKKGVSIDKVSKLLAHAALRETQVYAKIVNQELDKAMDLFD